jgi:hypothetical protein
MITLLLLLSLIVIAVGTTLIARRIGSTLNPYTLMAASFGLELVIMIADPFNSKPVPGSVPSVRLGLVVLGAMVMAFAGILLGLNRQPVDGSRNPGRLAGIPIITLACSFVSLATLVDLYRKAGGFPLFIIGKSFEAGVGTTYSDYYTGLFMYGLGICRIPAIALATDYVGSRKRFLDHLRENYPWYGITITVSALMVLGGQRNCLFWPFACWIGAHLLVEIRSFRSLLPILTSGLFLGWFFSFIGSLRLGSSTGASFALFSYFQAEIPNNALTRSLVWIPTYLGPSLYNLNAALLSAYEPTMGRSLILRSLPDEWLPSSFSEIELIVEHLDQEGLMPMFGQTFRTALADFYGEFGIPGAVLGPGLLLFISARAYRNATRSVWWCYLYFAILPGVLMMPFLDFFTGSTNLMSIFSCFVIPTFFLVRLPPGQAHLLRGIALKGDKLVGKMGGPI